MRARTRLALDASLLVAFVAAYRPAWTGLTVHQWLSLVIVAPLLVHGVVNWDWTLRIDGLDKGQRIGPDPDRYG